MTKEEIASALLHAKDLNNPETAILAHVIEFLFRIEHIQNEFNEKQI